MTGNANLVAFVHIEKTAGTTLIHLLRHNFFMRYCDVRPLAKRSRGVFQIEDLRKTLCMNPFLKCIAGHSIMPFNGLHDYYPNLKYITVLRDPVQRYLSQYQYWCRDLGKDMTFEDFLSLKRQNNRQTRKIAGSDDVSVAKEFLISGSFLLTGLLEEFDAFLVLLKKKLSQTMNLNFDPLYERQRVGTSEEKDLRQELVAKFGDHILENNRSDLELYDFVASDLFPRSKKDYGVGFVQDLEIFRKTNEMQKPIMWRRYLDYLCRKLYYERVSGCIRYFNGLPAFGSY